MQSLLILAILEFFSFLVSLFTFCIRHLYYILLEAFFLIKGVYLRMLNLLKTT